LPQNDKSSLWKFDTSENNSVIITNKEKNYCTECTYLIGINTRTSNAKYSLTVEQETLTGFVEKTLTLGIPFEDEINANWYKWYSVIVE